MLTGFESFVARRYVLTKKKTGFISIISVISIAGIALGVAALIIVLSLMNGFTKELRTRLVGMSGHIWVGYWSENRFEGGMDDYGEVREMLLDIEGVVGASPYCSYRTVANDRAQRRYAPLEIRGVDLETVDSVSDIRDYITEGSMDLGRDEDNVPGIVLGRYVALNLNATMIGDEIFVFGEGDVESIIGSWTPPPVYKFRVTGIFDSGYYDYDNGVGLVDMAETQRILGYDDEVSGMALKLGDAFAAQEYTAEGGIIDEVLGGYPYWSEDWIDQNKMLFSWMKLEKWAAFIVLSLIILVAAFNIISTLIMMVMDKTREVGILKSMGATSNSIKKIFVYQGAFVGVTGTVLGSIIGYTLAYVQDTYRILSLPADIYFVSAVPMDLQLRDFIVINLVALFLCWLSSYYPAQKAASLDPVEAIRSE